MNENFNLLTDEQNKALKIIISESKKLVNVDSSIMTGYLESIGYKIEKVDPVEIFKRLAGLNPDKKEGHQ